MYLLCQKMYVFLAKDLQESPKPKTTEDGDREVVVPTPQVDEFAAGSDNARHNAHDTESQWAGDSGG